MDALLIVQLVIMGAIFFCSAVGNSLVVYIVCKKKKMQSVTNWLILNLSLADLTVSVVCIPLEVPLLLSNEKWIYGPMLCPVLYPLQTAAIYGSVLTLVSLSISRYWAILFPMRRQPTVKQAKILIGIVWFLSILFCVPYIITLKYEEDPPSCGESWSKNHGRIYTLAIFISQFLFPLLIISITYYMIVLDLRKGIKSGLTPLQKIKRKETTRVVKMLVIVTITFASCILPYHVVFLAVEFGNGESFPYLDETTVVTYLVLYTNSACNPIIYNIFNESFRHSFIDVISNIVNFCKMSRKKERLPQRHLSVRAGLLKSRRSSTLQTMCYIESFSVNKDEPEVLRKISNIETEV